MHFLECRSLVAVLQRKDGKKKPKTTQKTSGSFERRKCCSFKRFRLLVPRSLVPEILNAYHCDPMGGHPGEAQVLSRLMEKYTWPGIRHDVNKLCKNCKLCATCKDYGVASKHLVASTHASTGYSPFEMLQLRAPRMGVDIPPVKDNSLKSNDDLLEHSRKIMEQMRINARKRLRRYISGVESTAHKDQLKDCLNDDIELGILKKRGRHPKSNRGRM
ncbi:Uncharacterised protein r2_g496 [Pycnogonum litorale]